MGDTSIRNITSNVIGICTKKGNHFILVRKEYKGKSTLDMFILGYTVYAGKCKLCLGKTDSGRCRYSGKLCYMTERDLYESRTTRKSKCPLDLLIYGRTIYDLSPVVTGVKSKVKLSLFISCFIR